MKSFKQFLTETEEYQAKDKILQNLIDLHNKANMYYTRNESRLLVGEERIVKQAEKFVYDFYNYYKKNMKKIDNNKSGYTVVKDWLNSAEFSKKSYEEGKNIYMLNMIINSLHTGIKSFIHWELA